MSDQNRSQKKVAIVTGASSGIGKETVRLLLQQGYIVHAGARRTSEMDVLKAAGAETSFLDLTKPELITEFVKRVVAKGHRIDLLVNNAGYGSYGAIEDVPMAEARAQIEVNLFAVAQLIQEVLPFMRKQKSGTIINISSVGGKVWSPLGGWYHASKFAIEGLSDALRNEVKPFGVRVVVIQPGAVKTEWGGIAVDSMIKTSGRGAYKPLVEIVSKTMVGGMAERSAVEPKVLAEAIVKAAESEQPKARYVVPAAAGVIILLRTFLSDRLFDGLWNRVFKIPKSI